jgi:FtsH-binding integral membrane protein
VNYLGIVGTIGLIGGGYYMLNSLNMPAITDTQQIGDKIRTVQAKPSIPKYIQDYLFNVYQYVASGLILTGSAAVLSIKTGIAHRVMSMNPIVATIGLFAAMFGSQILVRSIDKDNVVPKYLAFGLFNAVMGLTLSGLCFYHPQILIRAGLYTLGLMGALSFTAMKAKEDKFLFLGGPLLAGLTVIVLSSIVGMFLPVAFVRTLSLIESLWLYGGLAIFCGFVLYDTQKLMTKARIHASNGTLERVDHMNDSISIYMDVINIFIRLVMILSNGNNRK